MNHSRDARRYSLRFVLVLSALLHLLLIAFVYFLPPAKTPFVPQAVYVDLNALPPAALPDSATKKMQIAETEQADNQDTPEDAKYLGERNQKVAEATKAKNVDSFRKGSAAAGPKGNMGKNLALKDLAPKALQPVPPSKQEMDGWAEKKKPKDQEQAAGQPNNSGAPGEQSASNDYLKNVKEGDATLLSTKEFVYFGYYRRIRQRLEVAWNSKLRAALQGYMKGGRQLASDKDYVTGVVVVLDSNGMITAVQLLQKSGATDLDQAAVDAFNEAGPFPDPPSGLVDKNGEIRITWSFVLQS